MKLSPEDSLWIPILSAQFNDGQDDGVVESELRLGGFPDHLIRAFIEYRKRVLSVAEESLSGRPDDP